MTATAPATATAATTGSGGAAQTSSATQPSSTSSSTSDGNGTMTLRTDGDTLVRIYAVDDAARLVGTVLFPAGGIKYAGGVDTFVALCVHAPGAGADAVSDIISISLPQLRSLAGVPFAAEQRAPRICLVLPSPASVQAGLSSLCLASRVSADTSWVCDDKLLFDATDDDGQRLVCGFVRHFTLFAVVRQSQTVRRDPLPAPPLDSRSDAGGLPVWAIVLLVLSLLCCCIVLLVAVLVVHYRSERQREKELRLAEEHRLANLAQLTSLSESARMSQ